MEDFCKENMAESLLSNLTNGKELRSDKIFAMMIEYLTRGDGDFLVKKVGMVFQFDILSKYGGPVVASWEIDLKSTPPKCTRGRASNPDVVFTMADLDFEKVCLGKLGTKMGYLRGYIKIKGSLKKAGKFHPKLFPAPTPENFAKYSTAKM